MTQASDVKNKTAQQYTGWHTKHDRCESKKVPLNSRP